MDPDLCRQQEEAERESNLLRRALTAAAVLPAQIEDRSSMATTNALSLVSGAALPEITEISSNASQPPERRTSRRSLAFSVKEFVARAFPIKR